jgi:hypothetical protein
VTPEEKHSQRSSEREEYVEYIFLAELCSHGWANDRFVEVSRSKTDAFGYDLVLSSGLVTRHVQLKASRLDGAARSQKINQALTHKPSGCVVWLKVDSDTLLPKSYGWLGSLPGFQLGELGTKIARHTKANAEGVKNLRQNIREVGWTRFTPLATIGEVFNALFGPPASSVGS